MGHKTNLPAAGNESPRRGDRVAAKHLQDLTKQVKRLSRQGRENYASAFPNIKLPFMPRTRRNPANSSAWQISVTKGYVIESMLVGDTAIISHMPDGIVDNAGEVIWHDIQNGESLYVKVATNIEGSIERTPIVEVDADDITGGHYLPEVFDYPGNIGEHNYKICRFVTPEDIELFCAGSHIFYYDERVTMINLEAEGDCYEVGKTYNEVIDRVEFRKLKQLSGEGSPVIKDQNDETINFKRIKPRTSPSQINVTDEGDEIKIHGNGNSGTLTHVPCEGGAGTVILEWDDGLIISPSASFTAGCSTTGSGGGGGIP